MTAAYLRLTRLTLSLCFLLPALISACIKFMAEGVTTGSWLKTVLLAAIAVGLSLAAGWLLRRLAPVIEAMSAAEATFLDRLPERWVPLAIAASAAASLALELTLIRWQGTVWEIFAFYKNFSLLSCFAGLGLGYALASRDRVPALMILPLLALQVVFLTALRHLPVWWMSGIKLMPIMEQLNMGIAALSDMRDLIYIYPFLGAVLLLTALAFIPVGQLCGRLLER